MSYQTLLTSTPSAGVALIKLNRPRQYNALNTQLLTELADALEHCERDDAIAVIVITGSEKAFAAGADIAEMLGKTGAEMRDVFIANPGWTAISHCKKPTICAVAGLALGGGFELALQGDILIAASNAKLGLPEVNLGVIPCAGGTQRITNLVGKSLAMEMVLNGRCLSAEEALDNGVVSRIVEPKKLEVEAITLAEQIAARAPLAVRAGKRCVNKAVLSTLEEGLAVEQETFPALFDSKDAQQLMSAFLNKGK
ncbi:MAG: enoyl-CoA hydratase [Cycloclasticus sp. symbiont of Bathymodiolus heckerae]|nr:MAG: enoyl-CoA hydratase [Cycloclasticus sp. symbiont of Bathymodiolus heckerae]